MLLSKKDMFDIFFYSSLFQEKEDRAGRMARVVEHLSNKCEALSSNPSAREKERTRSKWVILNIREKSQ
jgi:hypothetical protein